MEKLKIEFRYFPREAVKEDNFFLNLLEKNFEFELTNKPDFVFFSVFNKEKKEFPKINGNFTKIFWTGENIRTDMKNCDFAFAFEYENKIRSKNYMRLPLYAYFGAGKNLIKGKKFNAAKILNSKTNFCNFVYSKDAKERVEFFKELSKYKKIDAPGKSMNNSPPIKSKKLGAIINSVSKIEQTILQKSHISTLLQRHFSNWREDVINFQKDYKFTIAFENASYPGYTTEKIYHPMLANSIPIYWGNPEISRDFNTKSFVNWHEYNDHKKVADVVAELDQNDKKYIKMLSQPWFKKNKPNKWCGEERIVRQLEKIFGVKKNE